MTTADLTALLPFIVISVDIVLTMLVLAFYRSHGLTLVLTLLGLAVGLATLPIAASAPRQQVTGLVVVDYYALFFMGLIFAAAFVVALISYGYMRRQSGQREEYYLLLLLATLGSAFMAAAGHFASFLLGLETLSVSLYGMIGYTRNRKISIEAALKYLVLAGASSAFLLFGMALVYAQLGTMEFARMAGALPQAGQAPSGVLLAGLSMLLVGFGFKLAVAPFHMWTPDVYEGAPAPATAFVATVSKGATFAILLRFFSQVDIHRFYSVFLAVTVIAIASMLVGNLLALRQNNVKRILAYSSISHLGYVLAAFLAAGSLRGTAVAFYLVAYFVTTLGAFGVVALLSRGEDEDAGSLDYYRGLYYRRPWLTAAFTGMLLSLAGIPLTAGFLGKFYVVTAGANSALWLLLIFLVIGSGIGVYYYLRVAIAMYVRPEAAPAHAPVPSSFLGGLAVAAMTILLIFFGVYPGPLIDVIQATVGRLD